MGIKENLGKVRTFFGGGSKERYITGQQWLKDLMIKGGAMMQDFIKDIYNDKILNPHEEMWEVEKLYLTNAHVAASVNILKNVLIGDNPTVEVENSDEYSKNFYERWLEESGYWLALDEALEGFILGGNGYIEIMRGLKTGIPKRAKAITRFWRVWVMEDEKGNKIFIEEVPNRLNKKKGIEAFKVSYGDEKTKIIHGIKYKNKVQHFKWGMSHYPFYGRSPLASAVSDAKILRELERAIAIIARYKAIPRKIINLLPSQEGTEISSKEKEKFIKYWASLSDLENPVVTNHEVKLQDLTYSGQETNFTDKTDYLKKKITLALAPEFYMHGSATTYAVALEQKNIFYLRVASIRKLLAKTINEILEEIRIKHNSLPENLKERGWKPLMPAEIKFGEFDFETKGEKYARVRQEWQLGLITLNEARQQLGYEEIEEIGDAFVFDLRSQQQDIPIPQSPRDVTRIGADENERKIKR